MKWLALALLSLLSTKAMAETTVLRSPDGTFLGHIETNGATTKIYDQTGHLRERDTQHGNTLERRTPEDRLIGREEFHH